MTPLRFTVLSLSAFAAAAALLVGTPTASAALEMPKSFPAAGELIRPKVKVRAKPNATAKVVRVLHEFRRDYYVQVILALNAKRDARGRLWYKLSLPGRPNGQRGWVRASSVRVTPVKTRIVVRRKSRKIELWRGEKRLLRSTIAVGKSGAETPLGRNFYVSARFVPSNSFLGVFALETSAYSKLTDWPGGGVAGIHGTSRPDLLGQAVSHGCVRVHNRIAKKLKRLAPLGTPIDIVNS